MASFQDIWRGAMNVTTIRRALILVNMRQAWWLILLTADQISEVMAKQESKMNKPAEITFCARLAESAMLAVWTCAVATWSFIAGIHAETWRGGGYYVSDSQNKSTAAGCSGKSSAVPIDIAGQTNKIGERNRRIVSAPVYTVKSESIKNGCNSLPPNRCAGQNRKSPEEIGVCPACSEVALWRRGSTRPRQHDPPDAGSTIQLNGPSYAREGDGLGECRGSQNPRWAWTQGADADTAHRAIFTALFDVTAYCSCPICCQGYSDGVTASGHVIQPGDKFVAADPSIPFGTMIDVPGYGVVPVQDRGGAIKGNKLDTFHHSHADALAFGRQRLWVTIRSE